MSEHPPAFVQGGDHHIHVVCESPATRRVLEELHRAARVDARVLLVGETGVGKEVAARLIHQWSARRRGPFAAVNCSGVPDTLLESELFGHLRGSFPGAEADKAGLIRQADQGTLFLDDVGAMSPQAQAALLHFAATGEVQPVGGATCGHRPDTRLISAADRDLRLQVRAGTFREDLLYRLNVVEIRIPPLRERREDIVPLFEYYLTSFSNEYQLPKPALTHAAADVLVSHPWPGNILELQNAAARQVIAESGHPIGPLDLPDEMQHASTTVKEARAASRLDATADRQPPGDCSAAVVDRLWNRLASGDDFWTAVQQPFKDHEITRHDLVGLIDRGLRQTHGSYRALLRVFNLPPSDYKRLLGFLHQHHSNLPVQPYRHV